MSSRKRRAKILHKEAAKDRAKQLGPNGHKIVRKWKHLSKRLRKQWLRATDDPYYFQ